MAKRSETLLRVSGLGAGYGQVQVIRDGCVSVAAGEVAGLVGRNGAGKTTFLMALAGLLATPATGEVVLDGVDIGRLPAHRRVEAGLAIVPSGGRLFKSLTVRENLTIGLRSAGKGPLDEALELFPELNRLLDRYAGKLSGGERQMVAIGRALMLAPRVLLMDEPSEGLAPLVVLRVAKAIRALRERGLTILIAEQNVKFTDLICDRWFAIDKGSITPLEPAEPARADATAPAQAAAVFQSLMKV